MRGREQEPGEDSTDPLSSLLAGDSGPFEAFVTRESPHLLAYFQHLGAARAEAEDLVQETFLKVFQSAAQYQPDGRFRGYAYRIARNAWIDRARRRARAPRAGAAGTQGGGVGSADGGRRGPGRSLPSEDVERLRDTRTAEPGADLDRAEQAGRFARALAALPEGQRLAFELGVLRELPYAEVADALGVPVGTVKSRVFHAVRRLRELLSELAPPAAVRPPAAPPAHEPR